MKKLALLLAGGVLALTACAKPHIVEVGYEWADRKTCVKEIEWSDGTEETETVDNRFCPQPIPDNYQPEEEYEGDGAEMDD